MSSSTSSTLSPPTLPTPSDSDGALRYARMRSGCSARCLPRQCPPQSMSSSRSLLSILRKLPRQRSRVGVGGEAGGREFSLLSTASGGGDWTEINRRRLYLWVPRVNA